MTEFQPMPQALLFDLDGTLFQTETLLLPAYHQTFERLRIENLYEGETPPEERILSQLGKLLEEIWRHVLPEADDQLLQIANDYLLHYQLKGLEEGVGEWYDGVEEGLTALKSAGYRLFIASNGLEPYVKGVPNKLGLGELFEGKYSAGEYQTESKVQLVQKLLDDQGNPTAWMVGDRSSDVEAGRGNQLPVIGCDYGAFGNPEELEGADVRIKSFSELTALLL